MLIYNAFSLSLSLSFSFLAEFTLNRRIYDFVIKDLRENFKILSPLDERGIDPLELSKEQFGKFARESARAIGRHCLVNRVGETIVSGPI